jgi:hypothetical protein
VRNSVSADSMPLQDAEASGMPSFLSPPFAFGIFTVRTGGGK